MSELLSYYQLCPITDDIIGLAEDQDENAVIITLGKKIVYVMQLNHKKQLKSWSTSENDFTCRVVFDFAENRYVGVLSRTYIKFWDSETIDINKVKRIKMRKPIHELLNVTVEGRKSILVVYDDGACESLDSAMESRSSKEKSSQKSQSFTIDKVQFNDGILSFVKREGSSRIFTFSIVDPTNLKSLSEKTINLERPGTNCRLMDFSVLSCKGQQPKLITFWSDKRLFDTTLDVLSSYQSIGSVHSILANIDTSKSLGIQSVNENCIAFYSSKDDGACVSLYNMKYKIVQSRVMFKVYFFNFKLWSIGSNIFLAMGEQLSQVPFRIGKDKLSDMIGSQRDAEVQTFVEREMLDEDPVFFDDALTFDEDQSDVDGMEMDLRIGSVFKSFKFQPTHAKEIASVEEATDAFNELRSKELYVDIVRDDEQPKETASIKCLSNVDEKYPIMSENFEIICQEYEKTGCSEIEITDKVFPVLIAANRTKDIGIMLKRYNHISEQMLVKILKYLLTCEEEEGEMEVDEESKSSQDDEEDSEDDFDENMICKDKKFAPSNILLSTKQSDRRDVLCIALTSSFSSKTIFQHLHNEIDLSETIKLIDCLYKFLSADIFDEYDFRGNLVDGEDFDLDQKLFEWFTLLLDSHYQQILLSRDKKILAMLESWLELVDSHSRILGEMMDMRPQLERITRKKLREPKKNCNRWYKITRLPLY